MAGTVEQAEGMKVFVSYSRDDVAFADQLVVGLEDRGFDPILDRHDIDAAENWKDRLGGLILSSDAVIFVLTERSASSPICSWEVDEARRLGKRILPVAPREFTAVPPQALSDLNWIHFYPTPALPGSGVLDGMRKLDRALRVDLVWLRERTRLMEQAVLFRARAGAAQPGHGATASAMLLRGDILAEAQDWARRTPPSETVPPEVHAFLEASAAQEARLKAEADAGLKEKEEALARAATASKRVRRASMIGALVAGLFLVAAAVAGWFASSGFDEVARQKVIVAEAKSGFVAQESQTVLDGGNGDGASALLLALYGDPEARMDASIPRKFAPPQGFGKARASLAAAYDGMHLTSLMTGHTSEVTSIAYSPDGKTLVSGGRDQTLRLWDAATGKEKSVLKGHTDLVWSVAFSPDGKRIASASSDKTIRLWDPATGKETARLVGHERDVLNVAFSRDGKTLVSGSFDSTVRLWDVETGKETARIRLYNSNHANYVALSPDGLTVATGSGLGATPGDLKNIGLWDVKTGKQIGHLEGHDGELSSVVFSPNGKTLASGSRDRTIRLWSVATGQELRRMVGHTGGVSEVAFSPDGNWLVSGSYDGTVRLWNLSGDEKARFTGGTGYVASVAFSPDGKRIASTTQWDNAIRQWSSVVDREPRRLQDPDSPAVKAIAFSPDGKLIASGGEDSLILLWDAQTGEQIARLQGHANRIRSIAFSRDGSMLASGSDHVTPNTDEANLILWNVKTRKQTASLKGQPDDILSLAFSPDAKTLASGGEDKTIRLWDVETGKEIGNLEGHTSRVHTVAFSPDGKTLVSGSGTVAGLGNGDIAFWDPQTKKLVNSLSLAGDSVEQLAYSPDGKTLAMALGGFSVRLWSVAEGREIFNLRGFGNSVTSVAFSPDGAILASGSVDATVRLWDVRTGAQLARLDGSDNVQSVAYSPDGKVVASAASDGIRLWTVPEIVLADVKTQVKMACEKLHAANAPLAFWFGAGATYNVLQDQPPDPDNPNMLVSPSGMCCRRTSSNQRLPADGFRQIS